MSVKFVSLFILFMLLFSPARVTYGGSPNIWPSSATPAVVDSGPDSSVELGVKFRSDAAGSITGIRFYKAGANTGTHTGSLWSSNGTRLAQATFAGETSSGWQQVNFTTPVPITPNTVYVASYHTNTGHYSINTNYFSTSGVDNPPLHALANGVSGGNGVYRYGSNSAFPNSTWNASNYWVDVVFQPAVPPLLTSVTVTPANAVLSVGGTQQFTATGSYSDGTNQNITTQATWTSSNTSVAGINSTGLATAVSVGNTTISATLSGVTGSTPLSVQVPPLAVSSSSLPNGILNIPYSTTLTATGGTPPYTWAIVNGSLPPGITLNPSTGALTGTPAAIGTSTFTVLARDSGSPSQTATWPLSLTVTTSAISPILILTNSANPFSSYYAEILLAEGLNEFALLDISSMSSASLAPYDVVILGQTPLTAAQVSLLTDWVNAGGNLIAMRPDKKLATLLGLVDAGSTLSEAYLKVDPTTAPGAGIVSVTMQFHGTADRYTLGMASRLAALYSNAQTATPNPAVSLRSVGSNGGHAAAFTYDLARSVVHTRQGNPAWVNQDRDGQPPIRSNDLFFGNWPSDPQPDWVDPDRIAIPQADEQQRLLANLIAYINFTKNVLPRFWYFPHGHKAAVVMTGDDHANGGTKGRFDHYAALSPPGASVNDWEAIRSTSYVYPSTPIANAQAYDSAGFEISLHLNSGCQNYTPGSLATLFSDQLAQWSSSFPGLPSPVTHRMHCLVWDDYTALAEGELSHGIRLDTNYYYWPPSWVADRPGLFTGSGIPMRFATVQGAAIDIYQAPTQMTDESSQSYPFTANTLLDRALGPEGYYGAFVANMHTDTVGSAGSDAIVSSAMARGVPIISARQLLKWLDARNASTIQYIEKNGNTQTFSISAHPEAQGLIAMAPIPPGSSISSVKRNGSTLAFSTSVVKGMEYAVFEASTGAYEINIASDATPPTITSVSPANGGTNISPFAQLEVDFSEPMLAATINTTSFFLKTASGSPVPASVSYDSTSRQAFLSPNNPLAPSTGYTATVKGGSGGVTDTNGNALANDFTWSFNTASNSSYSIWSAAPVPGVVDQGPDNPVELGIKFRSDVAGTITAIRFYKSTGNTGTHVGNLWSNTGTLLATVTFTGETASGWQQANFNTPVAVAANTVYIASYHTNTGHYSINSNYFSASGVDNTPLHAPSAGESGGNGVYRYGSNSGFPNQTWNATNYWVDVVFRPN
ncbi:MAG TPA: DUF4082 domain-containing protein [Chthoniobacterales bacterium]